MTVKRELKFEFKDVDKEGLEILDVISAATKFNRWLYDSVSPYCEGKILEIGSGLGNISAFFKEENKNITLSDIRANYRMHLANNFDLNENDVLDIDIAHTNFSNTYPHLLKSFDTVFALNVVEHIENDDLAIKNMYELLKPGGQLIILVPAYQFLYNAIDHSLEHFKRYNKKSLSKLMGKYAPIKKTFYFNATGIFAWWFSGKVLQHKTIPASEMKLYNSFVPLFKLFDALTLKKFGLSVVCVIKKP